MNETKNVLELPCNELHQCHLARYSPQMKLVETIAIYLSNNCYEWKDTTKVDAFH